MPQAALRQQQAGAQGSHPYNARDVALKGASFAFGKLPTRTRASPETDNGEVEALTAARQSTIPKPACNNANHTIVPTSRISHLALPPPVPDRGRPHSTIAATLAAARYTPCSDFPGTMRSSMLDGSSNSISENILRAPRASSCPTARLETVDAAFTLPEPTAASSVQTLASQVPLLEQRKSRRPTLPAPAQLLTYGSDAPLLASPMPTRNINIPLTSSSQGGPNLRPGSSSNIYVADVKIPPKPVRKPAKFAASKPRVHVSPNAGLSPVPQTVGLYDSTSMNNRPSNGLDDSAYTSAPEMQTDGRIKPVLPPPRRSAKQCCAEDEPTQDPSPQTDRPVRADRAQKHFEAGETASAPPDGRRQLLAPPPISSRYKREALKITEQHLNSDSLADAMVGAALAGSRLPSPAASSSPIPPPPRRSKTHHNLKSILHSRDPSPQRIPGKLKPTLRRDQSTSDSDSGDPNNKHKKKRHLRPKHPNRHAEGARKRWRDVIAERERKRYEGVWAANRGLLSSCQLQPHGIEAGDVCALVVRNIWDRSRLPSVVLEDVWNLVDGRGVGRLGREEFVVGMWLIDQALKGRKLPVKVQDSVWASVRGAGVKVRIK